MFWDWINGAKTTFQNMLEKGKEIYTGISGTVQKVNHHIKTGVGIARRIHDSLPFHIPMVNDILDGVEKATGFVDTGLEIGEDISNSIEKFRKKHKAEPEESDMFPPKIGGGVQNPNRFTNRGRTTG